MGNFIKDKETNHFEVLIIEDEPDHMRCVDKSLPENIKAIPVIKDYCDLCRKGIDGCLMVDDNHGGKENVYFKEYIKTIIEEHHQTLRAIVCDLALGEKYDGGVKFIKWLRDTERNCINLVDEYLKYIPIIVYTKSSKYTDQARKDALENGAISCVIKNLALISGGLADENLRNILYTSVKLFNYLCNFISVQKKYKVGLSFTGDKTASQPHRAFMDQIKNLLYRYYTKKRVFYDLDVANEGITTTLKMKNFTKIYKEDCEYVIVFVSKDYSTDNNPWTQNEWVGIKDYYEKSPHNVIFVPIEDDVTEDTFKTNLGIDDVPLWVNGAKIRENFYLALWGKNAKQKDALIELLNSSMKDYLKKYQEVYNEECENIIKGIITTIVNHISITDAGEK